MNTCCGCESTARRTASASGRTHAPTSGSAAPAGRRGSGAYEGGRASRWQTAELGLSAFPCLRHFSLMAVSVS
jgi:hypothetical protein